MKKSQRKATFEITRLTKNVFTVNRLRQCKIYFVEEKIEAKFSDSMHSNTLAINAVLDAAQDLIIYVC